MSARPIVALLLAFPAVAQPPLPETPPADACEVLPVADPAPAPFTLTLVDVRFHDAAPHADLEAAADLARAVLAELGYVEEQYDLSIYDGEGLPHGVVLGEQVAADVLAANDGRGGSSPATHAFRKAMLERTNYAPYDQSRGELWMGVVAEWPTGRDHGSVTWARGMEFYRTFCTVKGYATCSMRRDCFGHELGHLFGLEHGRHDWYGYDPQPKHLRYIRGAASCRPIDIEAAEN